MSARLEALERERRLLVARSSLARLRLRRDSHRLRHPFRLAPLIAASARIPAVRGAVFSLALSLFGAKRVARAVGLASSILLLVRLVR
ncbi:MAG TPA: hypothetical protein VH301_08760 [Usitatibacter sp.]|jgi:hypothetical protein|nr:hypothetical protein [Usitatibacter sp.]